MNSVIVVASANGKVGIEAAWRVLIDGGTALDAVERGVRAVEDDPDDQTVGYGGFPNLLGQVELDASIMDGTTRRAGAVAALRDYRHAISVARAVLEHLPHVLIVGEGARWLAAQIGMKSEDLLTPEARVSWRRDFGDELPEGAGDAAHLAELSPLIRGDLLDRQAEPQPEPQPGAAQQSPDSVQIADTAGVTDTRSAVPRMRGTVNFLALDGFGHTASAVSTSGWAGKYPGRVGDSPVIGGGNYCDGRYGAAACTGWGELAIRSGAAHNVVASLAAGQSVVTACRSAMADLIDLEPEELGNQGHIGIVALDSDGAHCAISTKASAEYVWWADGMTEAAQSPRLVMRGNA